MQNIFRIEREGEAARLAASRFAAVPSDRRLLWHGSRCTNFGGILSQGLRIAPPEAPVSGYMFGKGIYLADMSSKSAMYCCAGDSNRQALLLLCEAEFGRPMLRLTDANYKAGDEAAAKGMVSTLGMGGTGPSKWMDAGLVHPSLKGVQMVCPSRRRPLEQKETKQGRRPGAARGNSRQEPSAGLTMNSPALSPTRASRPARPTSPITRCSTTSTFATTWPRSSFAISSTSSFETALCG